MNARLKTLEVRPGDVLIVNMPVALATERMVATHEALKTVFPDTKVLVVHPEIGLRVMAGLETLATEMEAEGGAIGGYGKRLSALLAPDAEATR